MEAAAAAQNADAVGRRRMALLQQQQSQRRPKTVMLKQEVVSEEDDDAVGSKRPRSAHDVDEPQDDEELGDCHYAKSFDSDSACEKIAVNFVRPSLSRVERHCLSM